ncbi:MAG: glycosyltransferase family 2 protein [Alphaproteobacteria bacterium]
MVSAAIPISVVVVTRDEEARIGACLGALSAFDDVWVVDSGSADRTVEIARGCGARVVDFAWDGAYPKKRQWCLEHLKLAHDWVFFVDADEVVTDALVEEIAALDLRGCAGFFVDGRYVWNGKMLRYGLRNSKLCLMDRGRMEFPVVDDLGLDGMGEIEGHYQPVLKDGVCARIGRLREYLVHDAGAHWEARHLRYADWEAGMDARGAWPHDPVLWRRVLKGVFKRIPFRDVAAFLHCYVLKLGFLDGAAGFDFARSRGRYYSMIRAASKANRARGRDGVGRG